jgi:hypothetical protein
LRSCGASAGRFIIDARIERRVRYYPDDSLDPHL